MAGIYIHIPFCRQKCYYCDFYKTVNINQSPIFITALKNEILQQKDFFDTKTVHTIYFGGGTPSVLTETELIEILGFLNENFLIVSDAEVTFEANPDDLDPIYLKALKKAGINRLSIGIQSFSDEHLKKMNRRHNAKQAAESVENAMLAGFNNISADLIYGLPGLTKTQWKNSLKEFFNLPVDHLSAYHLTYHKGTPFYTWLKKGTLRELPESKSVDQFNELLDAAELAGFEQYEISNFARNGKYSKHNSSYWTGEFYLGLGPSAHSFNGISRRWNVAHVEAYCKGINSRLPYFEEEHLTETDKFNDYIITRIRTKWGISIHDLQSRFGKKQAGNFLKTAAKHVQSGKMKEKAGIYTLTRNGLFISDNLMTDFIII